MNASIELHGQPADEYGGFTLDASDAEFLACIDEKLRWLTRDREIGYAEWREAPMVFLERAGPWEGD